MESENINGEYLTIRQAARLLNCSIASIYTWRKAGYLHFVKLGGDNGHNRISTDEIRRFVNSHTTQPQEA